MANPKIRRIAISTGGGDAPGLNAVIRAVVLSSLQRGWECYGIHEGYNGLLTPELYPDGGVFPLTRASVAGITHLGGTILGTTNRGNPLRFPVEQPDGSIVRSHRGDEPVAEVRAARPRGRGAGTPAVSGQSFHPPSQSTSSPAIASSARACGIRKLRRAGASAISWSRTRKPGARPCIRPPFAAASNSAARC